MKTSATKTYEVEIKTLLGSKESADGLRAALAERYPDMKLTGKGRQLNHYFNMPSDTASLVTKIRPLAPAEKKEELEHILTAGHKISLRTRDTDGDVRLVLKASVGDDTSSNGVRRIECEFKVASSLDELDKALLSAGATYQAKWSREREEYTGKDMNVCIDRNAGYGYLAEFEKVTQDEGSLDKVHADPLSVMAELGVSELPQDRLERMFAHYNAHWPEYYGSEKTFIIE